MKKQKDENKICNICKLIIDKEKEFIIVTHMSNKDKKASEGFYHVNCFRERISGGEKLRSLQNQAQSIFNFAKKQLGMKEEKKDVEVTIF